MATGFGHQAGQEAREASAGGGWRVLGRLRQQPLLVILILLCLLLSAVFPTFATVNNWILILQSAAIVGIMGLGLAFVMIAGSFDLSFAATMLLSGAVSARVIMALPEASFLALLAGPAVGAVTGFLNGAIVVGTGISPLLATIANGLLIRAFAVLYVLVTWMEVPQSATGYLWIGQGFLFGIPVPVYLLLLVVALAWLLLQRSIFGRALLATGANPAAARVAGLRTKRIQIAAFTWCGACAGVAGVINVSSVGGLSAVFNISYLYDVITVVVVGGVSFFGGIGSVGGVVLGLLVMGVIKNAMIIMNTPHYLQNVAVGFFLLLAIGIDSWVRRRRE